MRGSTALPDGDSSASLVGEWDGLKMSAFTKRQPDEGQGASSGWLPGWLPVFAGNLHQLAFRGWSTNGHGQIFLFKMVTRRIQH